MQSVMAKFGLSESDRRLLRMNVECYYDVQQVRIEMENRLRQYSEMEGLVACVGEEAAEEAKMKGPTGFREEISKYKPNEKKKFEGDPRFLAAVEKAWNQLQDEENHNTINDYAKKQENILKKTALVKIEKHPIWQAWLSKVNGIGPCLAGGMLGLTSPDRAPYVSNFWKYAGLAVDVKMVVCTVCKETFEPENAGGSQVECPKCKGPLFRVGTAMRREKGKKLGFNPRVKTLAYKIGSQFVRTSNSKYRALYDRFREEIDRKPCHKIHLDETTKKEIPCFAAHKHAKAVRLVGKIFFSHYWQIFRVMAGLPVPKPFAYGVMGHDESNFIEPMVDEGEPLPLELRRPWEVKK